MVSPPTLHVSKVPCSGSSPARLYRERYGRAFVLRSKSMFERKQSDNATAAHARQDVYVTAVNLVRASGIAGALGLSTGIGVGAGVDQGLQVAAPPRDEDGDLQARHASSMPPRTTAGPPRRTIRAGVPTAVHAGGTSRMITKELAPTFAFAPTVMGPSRVVPVPM